MQGIPISYFLILSAILFSLGVIGVVVRRNAIIIFMSIELMLNAVNLTFIAFSNFLGNVEGQIFVFMVMVVARRKWQLDWPLLWPSIECAKPCMWTK